MRIVIVIIIIVALATLGIGAYLGPNDLANCPAGPNNQGPCKVVDAIVAVSGGDTKARTAEAVSLYKSGWSDTLIFSGAAIDKSGPSNAAAMRSEAIAAGVPEKAILVEEYGATTRENAENTQKLFQAHDIKSVILVTSAYHQRRASLEFTKRVAGSVSVTNHPVAADDQWARFWWLTGEGWYLAISELVKVLVFYAGGTR
jgi:uncharacterized SAM-binding protein YcdF (DUF218 family)